MSLSRLFDNKSEFYKLFWFQTILDYVSRGRNEISFEELRQGLDEGLFTRQLEEASLFVRKDLRIQQLGIYSGVSL